MPKIAAVFCFCSTAMLLFGLTEAVRTTNELHCMGEVLQTGQALYRNEFIGPDWSCPDGGERFGLDQDGFLGAWDYDGTVAWHSGSRGSYLRMQRDGNLVLYNQYDQPVWDTHCFGAAKDGAVELRKDGTMRVVTAVDKDEKLHWVIYNNGEESECYPGNDWNSPDVNCRGNVLGKQSRLYPNEYICDRVGQQIRFGLNNRGRLALWIGKRVLWTPPLGEDKGDFLAMQGDGNLVLYKYNSTGGPSEPLWKTDCLFDSAILKVENGGVKVEKRNGAILWMVDSMGIESACEPQEDTTANEDCSSVSLFGDECAVQMIDFLNMNIVNIKAKDLGGRLFTVTDNFDEKSCRFDGEPWETFIDARNLSSFEISGTTGTSCEQLLSYPQYQMKDDVQLTFIPLDDYMCTKFGRNLIYFMVFQWFYFG